ncbi:MAG: hypothetical protein MJH09_05750 [Cetobacterium sp.]|nr:hypothetical protein [Cetobacterium sp.]
MNKDKKDVIFVDNFFGYEKVDASKLKGSLYHFTTNDNLKYIFEDMELKADVLGYVYLAETLEDIIKFMILYSKKEKVEFSELSFIYLKIGDTNIDIEKLYIYDDYVGLNALAYNGDISFSKCEYQNFQRLIDLSDD